MVSGTSFFTMSPHLSLKVITAIIVPYKVLWQVDRAKHLLIIWTLFSIAKSPGWVASLQPYFPAPLHPGTAMCLSKYGSKWNLTFIDRSHPKLLCNNLHILPLMVYSQDIDSWGNLWRWRWNRLHQSQLLSDSRCSVYSPMSCCAYKYIVFTHLKEWQRGGDKRWEGERGGQRKGERKKSVFHLLVHFPNGYINGSEPG